MRLHVYEGRDGVSHLAITISPSRRRKRHMLTVNEEIETKWNQNFVFYFL